MGEILDISSNKEKFISLCKDYIKREGIDKLLAYLEKTDFYEAPSSTNYHLNIGGGLCLHSINVFDSAMKIYNEVVKPSIESGKSQFSELLTEESIAIACLFHDICKANIYHKSERWRKDKNNHWESYEGYELKDEFPFGHGEKSCIMLNWFVKLHKDELLAIRWHMGMFEITEQGSISRFSYRSAMEASPLVALLQTADMITSNCVEKTYEK